MTAGTPFILRELGVLSADRQAQIAEKLCDLLSEWQ
jgi:hypothetical protein